MNTTVRGFPNLHALSRAAAAASCTIINQAVRSHGRCSIALSGGTTPRLLYSCFAEPAYAEKIPWDRLHIFWGDERCVPPDLPESNYRLAWEPWLSKVPIPAAHIYRMQGELADPAAAASAYEDTLRSFFDSGSPSRPGFDLVLLGLGNDGHTASLFPGDAALAEHTRLVRAVTAPPQYETRQRLTLTLPALCTAAHILFLISGRDKQPVLEHILNNRAEAVKRYPAARVAAQIELGWLINEGA
ncbi:6-phosphogluconolactonase [Thermodesulfobacteriota bacterium]